MPLRSLLQLVLPMLSCAALAITALHATHAHAQPSQVKPYFLVVFDTSGSMDDDVRDPNSANTCNYGGNDPSKMDEAKCALGRLVNATGDADFGLMQFAQTWDGAGSCSGGSCTPTAGSALLRVPIQTNSALQISALIDDTGTAGEEDLCPSGYTPLGGTLVAAKDYFEGNLDYQGNSDPDPAPTDDDPALDCRPLSVILLTDGVECCNGCANSSPWNVGCPNADDEITAAGLSACRTSCGTFGGCGGDDGFESAPEKAWLLREQTTVPSADGPTSKRVQTYVIGFGISQGDERIERIAIGGGTDNPSDGSGGLRAFYADDEEGLALAFAQIIADAQPPAEECNNEDDDCDGLVDEGLPKFCNKPEGIDDPLTCEGADDPEVCCEEPAETLCDGEDDDCDGIIDEGLLNDCGVCPDDAPDPCDGIDNDCDGEVDEDFEGGACGEDEGECEAGQLECVGGELFCRGEVGPSPEVCNCKDDDCDGVIDEDPEGSLCPDGRCIACECVPFCETTEEFQATCTTPLTPDFQDNGECLCIDDNCDDIACAEMEIQSQGDDSELLCAPSTSGVGACLCRAGACTHRCDGVTCPDGEVCELRTGLCREDNCRGLGCDGDNELCDVLEGECVTDACADASCDDDEACRDGECEPSCADVACEDGQRCEDGRCVEDRCAGVRCDDREHCNPGSGECEDDPCRLVSCRQGLVCDRESGECDRDPCWNVTCPSGQSCAAGQCLRRGGGSGGSGGASDDGERSRFLATGGGGCVCSAVGAPVQGAGSHSRGLLALGLLGVALVLRASARRGLAQRRRPRLRERLACVLLIALAAVWLVGCTVNPFCLDCVDSSSGSGGAGANGAGEGGEGGASGTAGASGSSGQAGADPDGGMGDGGDGGIPMGCKDGPREEICNGEDDDCDFRVDEGLSRDGATQCDQLGVCAGTDQVCIDGRFACRYPDERKDDELRCDGIDEDCDGRVDETFDGLGGPCVLGVGACQTEGVLVCDASGMGLVCQVDVMNEPQDEICDGIDNDCDGAVDEPKSDNPDGSYVRDAVVQVATNRWMYAFEASRPDAKDDDAGRNSARACSREGVRPWTNITYEEALAACEAADMTLCDVETWRAACETPEDCLWGFTPSGAGGCITDPNAYPTDGSACNGHDLTAVPGEDDNDALAPTGSFARCFADHDDGRVFDLSGNAKEWTTGPESPGGVEWSGVDKNPLRGGSYNNLPGGMRCDFDFAVGGSDVRIRNVGFRCCSDEEP